MTTKFQWIPKRLQIMEMRMYNSEILINDSFKVPPKVLKLMTALMGA